VQINGFSGKTSIAGSSLQNAARKETGEADPTSEVESTETFQPTADLTTLLDSLNQVPLLRQDVVADAAARLNAGELNTPVARAETVNAILSTTLSNG
jgi:hypothetical protein